jgi:hypothetical protein
MRVVYFEVLSGEVGGKYTTHVAFLGVTMGLLSASTKISSSSKYRVEFADTTEAYI